MNDEIEIELNNDSIDIDLSPTDYVSSNDYEKLINKPQINGVVLQGNISSSELGINGDLNYVHQQTEASDVWEITHNLNKYPAVSIINSAGDEVIGEVKYNSLNKVTITFSGAFKGNATLN